MSVTSNIEMTIPLAAMPAASSLPGGCLVALPQNANFAEVCGAYLSDDESGPPSANSIVVGSPSQLKGCKTGNAKSDQKGASHAATDSLNVAICMLMSAPFPALPISVPTIALPETAATGNTANDAPDSGVGTNEPVPAVGLSDAHGVSGDNGASQPAAESKSATSFEVQLPASPFQPVTVSQPLQPQKAQSGDVSTPCELLSNISASSSTNAPAQTLEENAVELSAKTHAQESDWQAGIPAAGGTSPQATEISVSSTQSAPKSDAPAVTPIFVTSAGAVTGRTHKDTATQTEASRKMGGSAGEIENRVGQSSPLTGRSDRSESSNQERPSAIQFFPDVLADMRKGKPLPFATVRMSPTAEMDRVAAAHEPSSTATSSQATPPPPTASGVLPPSITVPVENLSSAAVEDNVADPGPGTSTAQSQRPSTSSDVIPPNIPSNDPDDSKAVDSSSPLRKQSALDPPAANPAATVTMFGSVADQSASSPLSSQPATARTPANDASSCSDSGSNARIPVQSSPHAISGPAQLAQMANKTGQSEMRIGLNTAAFGKVQVRTVIHASEVGLQIGSEKGDLRNLIANDLPGIANTLQQQNLRLAHVSFQQQGFAFSADSSSAGSNPQQRSFSPRTNSFDQQDADPAIPEPASAPDVRCAVRGTLSILA